MIIDGEAFAGNTRFSISCRWRKTGIKMRSGDDVSHTVDHGHALPHVIFRLDLVKFSFGECALSPEKRRLTVMSKRHLCLDLDREVSTFCQCAKTARWKGVDGCRTRTSFEMASCLLSIRSSGPILGLRGALLYGASSASAGLHYGVRCWYTTMTQCVQRRRKLSTGVGVCSPRPAGNSEFCNYELAYWMRRTGC